MSFRSALAVLISFAPFALQAQVAPATPAEVAVTASAGGPPAVRFGVDEAHSAVEFTVRFMGLTRIRGRFADFRGTIMYAARDQTRSTVTLMIDARTIDTDVDSRDNDLRKTFFEAEKYPWIVFHSTSIERSEGGFLVHGPLTMHGVTREIVFPLRQLHGTMKDGWQNVRIGFEGELQLNRKDYGVVGTPFWNRVIDMGRLAVADTVTIELSIQGELSNYDLWDFGAEEGKKSVGAVLEPIISERGVAAALARYAVLKRDSAAAYTMREPQLNLLGNKLLQHKKYQEAVAILRLNSEMFPASANAWDSLGEAYAASGNRAAAVESYQKALAIDPNSANAMEMLRWLKS